MMRKRKLLWMYPVLSWLILLGCSTLNRGEGDVRTARNIPESFSTPAGMAWGANACLNPIIDPADGTDLSWFNLQVKDLVIIGCREGSMV
jgi:hypothetical protein